MSEDNSFYVWLKRALAWENPPDQATHPTNHKQTTIASLQKMILERDSRITDLQNLVSVLWAAIFGLMLITIWACLLR